MSINLPYVQGTSEKPRYILRSYKIRSPFYAENTLRKLLCKPKDRAATDIKNNIVYEICKAVYFGESKRYLNGIRVQMNTKDLSKIAIVKRIKLQNSFGKQIITLAGIRRKLLIGKAG